MALPKPAKLVLRFEDGTSSELPFGELPSTLQSELLAQPFASRPSPHPEKEKFLLIEWQDGWKEVTAVDEYCTAINRYYVISRPEEVGRLSLSRADGYPELLEIVRRPGGVRNISFGGSYEAAEGRLLREGKKTERHFSLTQKGDGFEQVRAAFREAAREDRTDILALAQADPEAVRPQCERIRRRMGLHAVRRQQDVLDFIVHLARTEPGVVHGPTTGERKGGVSHGRQE